VEELRQLLEYMEVGVDPELDDKERLVKLIISQKNMPAVSASLAPQLQKWRQRCETGVEAAT